MTDDAAAHYAAHETYFREEAWALIAPGFTTLDEVLEVMIELVEYDDDNPMTAARAEQIVRHYWAHRQAELVAPGPRTPSDDERVTRAFVSLHLQGIVAKMNAGFDTDEAIAECESAVATTASGPGFVFFHGQDAARLAYPGATLYIGYGAVVAPGPGWVEVAEKVANAAVAAFREQGLDAQWDGDIDHRIELRNVVWRKPLPA